jgi:hypothetical protein
MRNDSDKCCRENKAHNLCTGNFLENFVAYDIMKKNVVEREVSQAIWQMRFACWISKAILAHARFHAAHPHPTHARTHAHTDM